MFGVAVRSLDVESSLPSAVLEELGKGAASRNYTSRSGVLFKFRMSTFSCAHADFVSSSCDWPEMVTALFHHHLQHRRGECLLPSFLRNGESEHNFNHCRFCKPSLAARAAWATSTRGASSRVSASVPFLPSRPRTSRSAAPRRSGGASPVSSRSWSPSAS